MHVVAMSSVFYVKGHSGYSSYTKCTQEGEYINNIICFPSFTFVKGTDKNFRNILLMITMTMNTSFWFSK